MNFRDMGYTRIKTAEGTEDLHVAESYEQVMNALAEARDGATPTGLATFTEVVIDWAGRMSGWLREESAREPRDTQRPVSIAPSAVLAVTPSNRAGTAAASNDA